ncbi:MAG: ABC transporter substrate-binding protein [Sulfobacillus benefaciens]|uniref:ABC transporter substrate-binding protein n=1 Tax=Sulfobacillus benefaciens TaxID=453960 RepID=A0A2T2XKK8_9FIRM|nr:MAG: ABC transporter substrate-binding protein [Sulfobacillus benefaciens]
MMKKLAAVGALSILSLAIAGCGSSTNTTATTATPQSGGTVVIALPEQTSPNWFFPELSLTADTTVNSEIDDMSYEPLVYFNTKDQFDPQHCLASSVKWNAKGTVYTIQLNRKWHWSNGAPVTAQDVVFTYQIMSAGSQSNVSYAWAYSGAGSGGMPTLWKSVVATGPYTVQITLNQPSSQEWFVRNGIGQIYPVPKSVWDKYPHSMSKEFQFIQNVSNSPNNAVYKVVDGPYQFQAMSPNNYWTFVPNPKYNGHQSYVKKVMFQYETSSTAEFTALKQGTVNYGYLPGDLLGVRSELTNDVLTPLYSLGFNYIQLNMSPQAPNGIGKAFDELPVRQALQLGVNQPGIINAVYHGYGVVDDTTLAPKPKNIFVDPALAKDPYAYNPARGKKILEADGWHEVDGVMTKHGIKLEFTMFAASGSTSYDHIDQILQQGWAQEGIICHIEYQQFNTVVSYSPSDASQWAVLNWNGGWGYASGYPSGGVLFKTGAAENSGSYSSNTMNTLINDTYKPGTPSQAIQRMYNYEEYAAKQLPAAIFLPEFPSLVVHAKNLHGTLTDYNPIGGVIFPSHWWISK